MSEHEYWIARRNELEDVLGPNGYGDSGLDETAELRLELLRPLVEHELPAENLADLCARMIYYRDLDVIEKPEILDALIRDAEALRFREEHLSTLDRAGGVSTSPTPPDPSRRDGQIRAALDADPSRSDRDIARAIGCSPTRVGNVRSSMGLSGIERTVRRNGQMYQMSFDLRSGEIA